MKRLSRLANLYRTDKGTEHWYAHGFTEFYEPFLMKYEHPTILEIGTAEGSSAKMLNAFFDGQCTIFTVDINPVCRKNVEGYDNILFYKLDCSNEEEMKKFLDKTIPDVDFDIIIEDGSHYWDHQMLSLYIFSKKLKEDGIYVLEDLHTSLIESDAGMGVRTESPLFFINFMEGGTGIAQERRDELKERIKDVFIYSRYNPKNEPVFKNRSITAIMNFRQEQTW